MSDWFILYLLTRVDFVKVALLHTGIVMGLIVGIFYAIGKVSCVIEEVDTTGPIGALLRTGKNIVLCGLALLAVSAVLPSRNDIVFIVGGSKLLEISRGDKVQAIGNKTLSIVEKYLEDKLKEGAKP